MEKNDIIQQLSKHLFWDVDMLELSPKKHQRFIIVRVMDRGTQHDVRLVWDCYGEDVVKDALLKAPALERKTIFFFANQFNISPEEFRAYRKQKELATWAH